MSEVSESLCGSNAAMRAQIRAEIVGIVPLDELEKQHQQDAMVWVDSGVELCRLAKPATPPKHLVSYFALVDGGEILLVDHKNAKLWLPTGGHVEVGEHPRDTVAREIVEELGIMPTAPIGPPEMMTVTTTVGISHGHVDVSLWYVVRGQRQDALVFDRGEFNDVRWFPFAEVPLARADPHMGRFLQKLARSA